MFRVVSSNTCDGHSRVTASTIICGRTKAPTDKGDGSVQNIDQELYESFFSKMQRTIGRKGHVTMRNFVEVLESSKVAHDPSSHSQESPGPLGPKSPKSLTKNPVAFI